MKPRAVRRTKILRLTVLLAMLLLVAVPTERSRVAAQATPTPEAIVQTYLSGLGITNVTFPDGYAESSCPAGYRCTGSYLALVPYEVGGLGGGTALVTVGTLTNPNAGSVIANTGGAMDVNDLESYGVVASQAQALISGLDALP